MLLCPLQDRGPAISYNIELLSLDYGTRVDFNFCFLLFSKISSTNDP